MKTPPVRVIRRRELALAGAAIVIASLATGIGVVGPDGDGLGPGADALRVQPPDFDVDLAGRPAVPVVVSSTGVVLPVQGVADGWVVTTPCGATAVLAEAAPVVDVDVVIDPGHGGPREPGAVGPNGLRESDLNLAVARLAAQGLVDAGYDVLMTRYADVRMPIVRRAEVIAAAQADVVVSVHHNGAGNLPRSSRPGTEVFHQVDDPASRRLAGLLWEEAVTRLAPFDVDWVAARGAGASARPGVDGTDFYGMLRRPEVPAALTEFAYLSNPSEAAALATPAFQQAEADAIVQAVRRWFETDDPGSGFVPPPFITRSAGGGGGLDGCVDPPLE